MTKYQYYMSKADEGLSNLRRRANRPLHNSTKTQATDSKKRHSISQLRKGKKRFKKNFLRKRIQARPLRGAGIEQRWPPELKKKQEVTV